MYTYDPNANKKNVDSENMNSLNEEDLFLAGGFDSFSPNQTANNSMYQPVKQMELDPSWNIERWKNKYELKFFEQLKLSFFPLKYDKYREMSIDGIKLFIRKYVAFELLFSFIIILGEQVSLFPLENVIKTFFLPILNFKKKKKIVEIGNI